MSTSHASILEHYQEIADLSGQMLAKAQGQEWNELVTLGARYQEAVERLKALNPLDDDQKNARRELLTRILDDDARIRQLIAPRTRTPEPSAGYVQAPTHRPASLLQHGPPALRVRPGITQP